MYIYTIKIIKNKTYKKITYSIELPIMIFIIYTIFLFNPLIYRNVKFYDSISKFNDLWVELKFLENLPDNNYLSFSYWPALLVLLTILSNYLLVKILLNARKDIKQLYKLLFILYNVIMILSLFNILSENKNLYPFVNPNHLATFISVPLPIIFYSFFIRKDSKKDDIYLKVIKFLYLFILLFLLFSTDARMALFSTFILMFIYMILERKKYKYKFIISYSLILLFILTMILSTKGIVNSNILMTEQITSSLSLEIRLNIITNSLDIFKDNFLFGVGPGQFSIVYPYYSSGQELIFIHHAHNDYIQFLVEYGLLGVFIMGFLYYKIISLMKYGLKTLKGNSYHIFLATIFSILIFHFEIIASFQSHIGVLFQLLIFLVVSLYLIIYNFDKHYKSNSNEIL